MPDEQIAEIKEKAAEIHGGNAGGHGFDHVMRVYRTALLLADSYPECERDIVAIAALLHDVDDHKLTGTSDNGNANARRIMDECGVDPETAEEVCAAVGSVSFSRNGGAPASALEGRLVQDADRLDAVGALGIARTFAYGGSRGRSLFDSRRHFDEKLLKLKALMNTPEAAEMAAERHRFMEEFLKEFDAETCPETRGEAEK